MHFRVKRFLQRINDLKNERLEHTTRLVYEKLVQ